MTVSLLKKEKSAHRRNPHMRITYEYEGRDLGDVSISQGTLKVARKPTVNRREAWNRFSSQPSEETYPAEISI